MKQKKSLNIIRSSLLGTVLALGGIAPVFALSQFIDFSSLFADVYSGSPGIENVVPYIESIDEDENGVDDKYVVGFNVYANNGRKLFSTAKKTGTYLPSLCKNPTWVDTLTDLPKFLASGKWAITAYIPSTDCAQSNGDRRSTDGTFVYVADVSKSDGVARSFSSPNKLAGINLVDYNSDNRKDVVITMVQETTSGFKLRYLVKDLDSWSTLSDKSIPVGVNK